MFTGEIQRSRSKKPFVVGGLLALLVVAVILFLPFPRTVKSTFTLRGATSTEAKAARGGTVAEVVSASGKNVASGAPLVKLDTAAAEKQVADAQAKVDALAKLKPASAKDAAKSQAEVKKAEAAWQAATKALETARAKAKDKKTPAVAQAEKKEKATAAALEKAKSKAKLSDEDLKAQQAAAQKALDTAKAELAACTITAPVSGVVVGLRIAKGEAVSKEDVLALVEGTAKLKAIIDEPANQPLHKGQALELLLDSGRKKLLLDDDAKGGKAVAEFDNASGELQPGMAGAVEISGDDTNLLSTLLGK